MGVGKVGGEVAFLAAATGLVDELNILDTYKPLQNAQTLDIRHTGLDIPVTSDPKLIRDSDIFIFAAGSPRTPDIKTRADLLESNLPVADACCRYLEGFGGVLISVTNPMDANNYYLQKRSGLERERCIGFGGQLDSARYNLSRKQTGISGNAFALGEHGEHQVPVFSANPEYVPEAVREEILMQMRGASMSVIKGKGGTVFGPAYHITELIRTVLDDKKTVLPCSCVLEGEYGLTDCSLGVPVRIGKDGIEEIIEMELDDWEMNKLKEAAGFVSRLCGRAGSP